MTEKSDDLTEYERLRLENIRRNEAFLFSIGFEKPDNSTTENNLSQVKEKAVAEQKRKRKSFESNKKKDETSNVKRRRSGRLAGIAIDNSDKTADDSSDAEETVQDSCDYEEIPESAENLDDFEFEVYTKLKKWRLLLSRELDIEPYRIFQNKTLCSFIRLKRDDTWTIMGSEGLVDDLLQCWGIGPSKVRQDGFGIKMLEDFDANDLQATLRKSLLLQVQKTAGKVAASESGS